MTLKNNMEPQSMTNVQVQSCKNCGVKKSSRFCNNCNIETSSFWKIELFDVIHLQDNSRILMKSGESVNGKPKREIEQYVGNKDKNIVSEFERLRKDGRPTRVIHRLWRWVGNILEIVHKHEK